MGGILDLLATFYGNCVWVWYCKPAVLREGNGHGPERVDGEEAEREGERGEGGDVGQ